VTSRNPWAILYASLIFGGVLVPYYTVGLLLGVGLFLRLPASHFGSTGLVLLGTSTALLLGVFVARTQVEQRLRLRLGRFFSPLRALLLALSAAYLILVTLVNMNPFPFAPSSGAWANLIEIATIGAVVAAIVVTIRPASNGPLRSGSTAPIHGIGPIVRPDMSRSRADYCLRAIGFIRTISMSVIAATPRSRIISTASFSRLGSRLRR
jgi:hypothetical protein